MRRSEARRWYLPFLEGTSNGLMRGKFGVQVLEVIGSGYSGKVVKCLPPRYRHGFADENVTAIKVIDKTKVKAKSVENEVKLLLKTQGPNVVTFHKAFECIDAYMIVLEYCKRGDLHGILDTLDNCYVMARCLQQALLGEYMLGVLTGLESLHSKLIVHADIKMKNILIGNNNVPKLADFGFAKKYKSEHDKEHVTHGTRDYWAPEMFMTEPWYNPFKADIYALGVTFVGVCEKRPIKLKSDCIHDIVSQYRDSNHVALFKGMLETDADQRWDLSQIKSNIWLNNCQTPPTSPL